MEVRTPRTLMLLCLGVGCRLWPRDRSPDTEAFCMRIPAYHGQRLASFAAKPETILNPRGPLPLPPKALSSLRSRFLGQPCKFFSKAEGGSKRHLFCCRISTSAKLMVEALQRTCSTSPVIAIHSSEQRGALSLRGGDGNKETQQALSCPRTRLEKAASCCCNGEPDNIA